MIIENSKCENTSSNKDIIQIIDNDDDQTMETEQMDFLYANEDTDFLQIKDYSSFMERENSNLIKNYGAVTYSILKESELLTIFPANFLLKNGISCKFRTKLVDWMMEVLHVFKCEIETIFLSVQIMDLFINKYQDPGVKQSLHLVGSTAIYMASKMEDIMPISVNNLINKILHNQYSS
jgi:hypothetical protein